MYKNSIFSHTDISFCQPINVYYQILLHEINIMQCHLMIKEKQHHKRMWEFNPWNTRYDCSHILQKNTFFKLSQSKVTKNKSNIDMFLTIWYSFDTVTSFWHLTHDSINYRNHFKFDFVVAKLNVSSSKRYRHFNYNCSGYYCMGGLLLPRSKNIVTVHYSWKCFIKP